MRIAIYPGTFDPITNGHVDILSRAVSLFDTVIVAVAKNSTKDPLFTERERLAMIGEAVKMFPNVVIDSFTGLLVHYAQKKQAVAVVRGLRAISDFEYEFQLALMNRKLNAAIETVFLMPNEKYTYLNSSIVREVARLKGDVGELVPAVVNAALKKKFR